MDPLAIVNAALDAGDHSAAALALLADPASRRLPQPIVASLFRIGMGSEDPMAVAKIESVAKLIGGARV